MRGKIEIMAHILTFCTQPRRKTRIMHQSNLSHNQLKTYLEFLTSKNLLMHSSESYFTAEKGRLLVQAYAQLSDALNDSPRSAVLGDSRGNFEKVKLFSYGQPAPINEIRDT